MFNRPANLCAHLLLAGALVLLATADAARAQTRIITDIAPVAALAEAVFGPKVEIRALVPPGTAPHDYALRPSDARALAEAEILVWIGPELSPWLGRIARQAGVRRSIQLDDALCEELVGEPCPDHPWLDPVLMGAWAGVLAESAAQDGGMSEQLHLRASAAADRLEALSDFLATTFAPVADVPFLVEHDALPALVARFALSQAGAMADGEATAPSAARLAAIDRVLTAAGRPLCLFVPGPAPTALARRLESEGRVRIQVIDILGGTGGERGLSGYEAMMVRLADDMTACLEETR